MNFLKRACFGTNVFALSNNHVYANQNNADIGDNVLQPGTYDGGTDPADAIGYLYDFVLIDFSGADNYMDAAIAFSSAESLGTSTPLDDGYGTPNSTTKKATPGQEVQKYGRTTGLTFGTVDTVDTTVNVCFQTRGFRCVKQAKFVDQIGITPGTFSAGGDSGSLIVTNDEHLNPVGLLFAGGSTHTFANQISRVLNHFKVSVDNTPMQDPPTENIPPIANFSFKISELTVSFTDQSYDTDGYLIKWQWTFGEGNYGSTDEHPQHTYAESGTYDVTLTVTDNDGGENSVQKSVTASSPEEPPVPAEIELTATAGKQNKTWRFVNLSWTGAESANVDIYRDDEKVITTVNSGSYTDKINNTGQSATYIYQVCEEGTLTSCSNEPSVTFN